MLELKDLNNFTADRYAFILSTLKSQANTTSFALKSFILFFTTKTGVSDVLTTFSVLDPTKSFF